jgi:hypothetical protein
MLAIRHVVEEHLGECDAMVLAELVGACRRAAFGLVEVDAYFAHVAFDVTDGCSCGCNGCGCLTCKVACRTGTTTVTWVGWV